MGASESVQLAEDDDEEEDEEGNGGGNAGRELDEEEGDTPMKKVLEQEPEVLPCHASASPLSPQLSSLGTPRLGPSIKVWDPYNVLAPPPLPPPRTHFDRSFSLDSFPGHDRGGTTEVFLICHGECHMNLRPDLVGGRCPEAALTPNGKRQARALAVFLKSQGIRFNAVYTSPLDRARSTAFSVCQELNFSEDLIQASDALLEMSQGHWEGCHRSEVYTSDTLTLMDTFQLDFSPPSGESLREIEFRVAKFLTQTILKLPEKLRSDFSSPPAPPPQPVSSNSICEGPPHWDLLHRPMARQGYPRKKSGKSRLQIVTSTGDHEADDEMSPRDTNHNVAIHEINIRNSSPPVSRVGVFTHAIPIKCLVTSLLGCSPVVSSKICIEDTSVTVLQHSWKTGWLIKRINDTAHLRLL